MCLADITDTATYARVAQLVEHDLAKVGAAGSSPVSRSNIKKSDSKRNRSFFTCIGNKNKPPAMQVCSQTALASSKKPPCYNEYKVRQPNHYNKEESKWTIIVYHTQNGHANII